MHSRKKSPEDIANRILKGVSVRYPAQEKLAEAYLELLKQSPSGE